MTVIPPSPAFFLLLAIFSLALAILVHFKAPAGPVRDYFTLFAISVAAWLASGFLLYSNVAPDRGLLWARVAFAAGAVLTLSVYHVLVLFPDRRNAPFGWFVNSVGVILALLSVVTPLLAREVTASELTASGVLNITVVYGPLILPFTSYVAAVLIAGVWSLVKHFRRASGIRRLQIQYLILGTAIPLSGVLVVNLILPLVFGLSEFRPYGRLFALMFLPVTAHAIVRHRWMDIKVFVQKAVVFGCAIAAGAILFGALVSQFEMLTSDAQGRSVPHFVVVAIIIAASFHPVKSWIERAFNRYFYRERMDYAKILKDSSLRLSMTLDPNATAACMTDIVSQVFKAELVGVYLRDDARDVFAPLTLRRRGETLTPDRVLPVMSPLIRHFESDRRGLLGYEIPERDANGTGTTAIAQVRELGGELAVALWHLGHLGGFLILGAKLSGDAYFAEDVDFLLTLCSQAAIAIENSQLHRQMEEERLRAERLGVIGRLASGLAHEIKNPLVAIRTFAELLPERFRDEEFHGHFSKIVMQEVGRIDGLVARLRQLGTRPAQQQLALVDLRAPIEETLNLLRGQLEQKHIRVHTEYGTGSQVLRGDHNLLKQLFLNLGMNAIDAIEIGGELHITLRASQTAATRTLVAEVTNSGDGIPDDVIGQIFDPFFTTKAGGSGLGLAICRNIADAHRARISARNSVSPKGVTFTVEFPVGVISVDEVNGLEEPKMTEHETLKALVE
jgi:signal transduction histidine kinase